MDERSLPVQRFASELALPGEPNDAARFRRLVQVARAIAIELSDEATHFNARTGDDDVVLVEVEGRSLSVVRAHIGDEPGDDRVDARRLGRLNGATLQRVRTPIDEWGDGHVTTLLLEHRRLPGGSLTIRFDRQRPQADEIYEALNTLVAS